jgi:integrase
MEPICIASVLARSSKPAEDQHKRAIERTNGKAKAEGAKEIQPFQPYILRHTALTQLAKAGCDVFTLARIAGHSSITITQRYVHPQGDAIERAFLQIENATLPALPSARS